MYITIITDCSGQNDQGRQQTRFAGLFSCPINFVTINPAFGSKIGSLEAGGNLIDVLDASDGKEGIVVVNIAPRGDISTYSNGAPFCYFKHQDVLVISTYNEEVFGFINKFGLTKQVFVTDVSTVLAACQDFLGFADTRVARITNSQFRSFDYVPYLAWCLWHKKDFPATSLDLSDKQLSANTIWYIDDFGNCKTTLFVDDLVFGAQNKVETVLGQLSYYKKLKDVPAGEIALYTGSSGLDTRRFVEIASQQGNLSNQRGLAVGSHVLTN